MTKTDFLNELAARLSQLPEAERKKALDYYDEILSDRIEDGSSEEEAVASMEPMDVIVSNCLLAAPLGTLVKSRVAAQGRLSTLAIVLLCLGFPLWFPLLIAFLSVALALFAAVWSCVFALWMAAAAMALAGAASLFVGPFQTSAVPGAAAASVGAGLILCGLAVLMYFALLWLTKQAAKFSAWIVLSIKKLVIKKETSK